MRIEQLYYFLEAVQTGSFTKAANNLYLKQPSLREGIINFENELGKTLFERSKNGVKLTTYGEFCLPQIQKMVSLYEMMKNHGEDHIWDKEKILKIATTRQFSVLLNASYGIYKKHFAWERRCKFYTYHSDADMVQKVVNKEIDMALISYFPPLWKKNRLLNAQQDKIFEEYELGTECVILMMQHHHPLLRYDKVPIEKLYDYLVIFMSDASTPVLEMLQQEIDIKRLNYITVTDNKLVKQYMIEENAIAFTLTTGKESFKDDADFRMLDKDFTKLIVAVYRKDAISEEVLEYIQIIKTLL